MGFEEVGVYPHTGYKMGRWCDMAIMALSPQPTLSTPAPAKSIHDLPDERVQEILQAKQRALLLSR
jgi:phosphinothricin acetyltransferase